MVISIYKFIEMLLTEAEERLGPEYIRSDSRIEDLKACCSEIASVLNRHENEGFEAKIDRDDNTVHIGLILPCPWEKN